MDRPYRPNKYVLRAPPPIPPRPESVSGRNYAAIERAPPLPPRPPTVSENLPTLRQVQTDPPPYDYSYQPASYQQQNVPVELEATVPPGPVAKPTHRSPSPSTAQSQSWTSLQTQSFPPPPSYPPHTTSNTTTSSVAAELPHQSWNPTESSPYQQTSPASLPHHQTKQATPPPPLPSSTQPRKSFWAKVQSSYECSPYVPEQAGHLVSSPLLSQGPEAVDNASSSNNRTAHDRTTSSSYTLPLGAIDNAASYHADANNQRQNAVSSKPLRAPVDNAASYHVQEPRYGAQPPSHSLPQDNIDSAASYFSHLTISQNNTTPVRNSYNPPSSPQTSPPTSRPRIEFNPPQKYTLRECPTTVYHLVTPGTWYFHPSVPEFKICAYCYEKNISSTQLSSSFQTWTSLAGGKPVCFFSVPRIKDLLWPRAILTGELSEVLDFFGYRLSLSVRECPGEGKGVKASEGVKWFQLNQQHQGRFPQFLACEACYEDYLLASSLGNEFSQSTHPQGRDVLFACNVAVPFIGKLVLKADIDTFITEASRRLELPECAKGGSMVEERLRRWYQPRIGDVGTNTEGLSICERCYNDFMSHTVFKNDFQLINTNSYSNAQRRCLHGLYQSRSVWNEAVESNDFNIWINAMTKFIKYPPCTLQIIPGTGIYQIPGVDNFDICQSCYVGIIEPYRLDRFFQPGGIASSNAPKACDLNPGHPSFAKYAIKLDESMITATFSIFTTYVSRVSDIPPCPKLDLVKGRKWYGEIGCRICPSCYEEVCRDTYLAQFFQPTPELLPPTRDGEDGIHCDLYSPRMRSKWQESCTTQSLDTFLQFASHRKSIYDRTVPEMRHLLQQAKFNLAMQKMHNTTSTFYNAMDGASAWQYNSNIRYTGGGVGGSFATPWGVTGAQEGSAAWGLMTSTSGMASRVGQLEGVWHTVE
ncbi:uncharacterized protein BDV14DRAFT_65059 [Aspergillus stella-maris]|uniref:uncharacterized protein n=1 Tax=Aspergillus stella-maris TaxID=1810926 RepID=UPI003CCE2828